MKQSNLDPKYLSIGGFIYSTMSGLWLLITSLQNRIGSSFIFSLVFFIAFLCVSSCVSFRKSVTKREEASYDSISIAKWFGIIFSAEGLLIGAGSGMLAAFGQVNWIMPYVALIVGLHFFPLGIILRLKTDLILGGLITAVVLAIILSIHETQWSLYSGTAMSILLNAAGWVRILKAQKSNTLSLV